MVDRSRLAHDMPRRVFDVAARGSIALAVLLTSCSDPSPQVAADAAPEAAFEDAGASTFDVARLDAADDAAAPSDDAARSDGATDAPPDVGPPLRPAAIPADPCEPGAFVDLDREGTRTPGQVHFGGSTYDTAPSIGRGPSPACFAAPIHPRLMRWTMRRRGSLEIELDVNGLDPVRTVTWAATTCAADAESLGCSIGSRSGFSRALFATRVLDAGTPVWIGIAAMPARLRGDAPVMVTFRVTLTERPPPVIGGICHDEASGPTCPEGSRCHRDREHDIPSRCVRDGAEHGRCVDGATCDPGLGCHHGVCERVGVEGESCSRYAETACPAGTRCVDGGSDEMRCLRTRTEGAVCALATGHEGPCESGLACSVETEWISPTGLSEVVKCRRTVGEGEVCGADLRRPCGPGLACVLEGNVRRCVAGATPTGVGLGGSCDLVSPSLSCQEGLRCRGGVCIQIGAAGYRCDSNEDCAAGLLCLDEGSGSDSICALRSAVGERCDDGLLCPEGSECVWSSGTGTCVADGSVGRRCRRTWPECDGGLVCDSEVCAALPLCDAASAGTDGCALAAGSVGGRCRDDGARRCDDGLICDPLSFFCVHPLTIGSACGLSPGRWPPTTGCEPGSYCSARVAAPGVACVRAGTIGGPCFNPVYGLGEPSCQRGSYCAGDRCASTGGTSASPCRWDSDCPSATTCVLPDLSSGRGYCAEPGARRGACLPGAVPCRDNLRCVAHSSDNSLLCDGPMEVTGSAGTGCYDDAHCAEGLGCSLFQCRPPGTSMGYCRPVGAAPRCDEGLTCDGSGLLCIPPAPAGAPCVGEWRLCPAGQSCSFVRSTWRCASSGALGGRCGEGRSCETGLVCVDGTCVQPLAVGAGCGPTAPPCGPELRCVGDSFDARCTVRGAAGGPCRDEAPYCDDGLHCIGGRCVVVAAPGSRCYGNCDFDASCEGPAGGQVCRRFGSESGRCRRTPGATPCDAPLRCGPSDFCEL
jgi:hypothetical protein